MSAVEVLLFEVGGERWALEAARVREVVRAVAVSRLPAAPPVVLGVVVVRGELVPVLDFRARVGLPSAPLDPAEHFVIADAGGRTVAVRTDRAVGLAQVPDAGVADPRAAVPGVEHVSGVARLADGVALVHDLSTFLSAAEAASLDAVLAAEAEA